VPKINVYLPDDLAAAVRRAGIPVSAICQQALAEAVRAAGEARDAIDVLRNPGADPPRLAETPRLRRVLDRTHGQVEPEQLLAALLADDDNLAVRILEMLDVDVPALRAATARAPQPHGGEPALSPASRLVLAAALEGAVGLGHTYLGTEHLLLGLAAEAGPLVGVTPERVRRAIPTAIGAVALGYSDASRLDAIERRLAALEQRRA
jgi:ATP-dependent Clp protease ATP-binding subunit ClpC